MSFIDISEGVTGAQMGGQGRGDLPCWSHMPNGRLGFKLLEKVAFSGIRWRFLK